MNAALEPLVSRLSGEFDHVLPSSLVEACVEQAALPGAATGGLAAAEQTARDDLAALADAATRSGMPHTA